MTPSLELRDVVRDYGKGARVGPVSFTADPGLFVSLLGPSGCGKTTLLRCIAGFEPVDDGTLIIDGHSVADIPAHRRGIGLVFQSYALFPHLTVAENVAFGLRLRRVPRAERGKRIEAALQTVGLAHLADRLPSQLSGGQQQRVAIARSIVLEPSIMLLDEPLSNLDYKLRLQMRKELHSLQRRLGMTFVFVTHDQSEALALSDRIIVLSAGKVEQIGTPAEVYRKPRSYFVADFIGGSNLLKAGAIESKGADGALVTLTTGDRFHAVAAAPGIELDRAWLSLRPEDLKLADDAQSGADTLVGKPIARIFSGDRVEVTIALENASSGAETVTLYASPDQPLAETVRVRAAPGSAVLVGGGP